MLYPIEPRNLNNVNCKLSIRFARQFLNSLVKQNSPFTFNIFVIPERFELSTPDLKDRCSNHLSHEIVLISEWPMSILIHL